MKHSPRALIFDCDGTLADTMPLHWHAWRVVLERHGIHFTEERFYALGGVPSRDILKMLREEQGLSYDHQAVSVEKELAFLPFIPKVKGIPEVVAIAREHYGKLPMAVASGGKKRVVEQVLQQLGIHHWFGAVVTSEDVIRQKPEPDIFLEAARRLGVGPQFCRGYEDTDLGMNAIRAAGMEAVDIRAFVTAARQAFAVRG
ncbi:MAG: HAD-IA family hydrolase [Verrucomicrobia bacterium]|nr:HAD-IA family hydrolase [Verrucomicrobiota bacterium]